MMDDKMNDKKDNQEQEADVIDQQDQDKEAEDAKLTFVPQEKDEEESTINGSGLTNNENDSREDSDGDKKESERTLEDLVKEEDTWQIPQLKVKPQSSGIGDNSAQQTFHGRSFPAERGVKASKLHLLILAVIGLLVIGGTVYVLKSQLKDQAGSSLEQSQAAASPQPSPELTPSPEPPPFERAKFKVRVLNGTTKSGLAATVNDKLKGLGYIVGKPTNAKNSDFEQTVVKVKPSAAGLSQQLTADLAPEFIASASDTLADKEEVDGEVILGLR